MTTPIDELAGMPRTNAGRRLLRRLIERDGFDAPTEASNILDIEEEARLAARSAPVPASNVSEGLRWLVRATARGTTIGEDEWGRQLYVIRFDEPLNDPTAIPFGAALARSTPAGLDVERLARALAAQYDPDPDDPRPLWDLIDEWQREEYRSRAKRIAAEYARLSQPAEETPNEP